MGLPTVLNGMTGRNIRYNATSARVLAEPGRALAALRTSSVESPFEALRTATTPLVGRDEKAKVGEVLISGEPGIDGKILLCISSMVS
jgi:hypothetical protein